MALDAPINPDEEANMEAVMAAAEAAGLQWENLTDEEKKSLYRDYTGEELAIEKIEDLVNSTSGGTMAGSRIFVADNAAEKIGQLGTMYMGKKKKDELSKQKAQAYEVAGGLAAGQANAERNHQMEMMAELRRDSGPPPSPPPQQGPPPGAGPPGGGPPPGPPPGPPQGGPPMGGQPIKQQIGAEKSMGFQGNSGTMAGVPSPPPGAVPQRPSGPPLPPPGPPGAQMPSGMQIPTGLPPGVTGINPAEQGGGEGGGMMAQMMEKLKMEEWIKKLKSLGG